MRREEELLQKFLKENDLSSLEFSWGTNAERYYTALNSNDEEVHIQYSVGTEEINLRTV